MTSSINVGADEKRLIQAPPHLAPSGKAVEAPSAAHHQSKQRRSLDGHRISTTNKIILVASVIIGALCLKVRSTPKSAEDLKFESTCAALNDAVFSPNVKTLFAEVVPAGTALVVPGLDASCPNATAITADICRLSLNVTTSAQSDVLIEVWLPKNWTVRFLSTGNGGINGCISYEDMAYATSLGFSSTGSNNGHSGQNGTRFLNNVEVVTDYSYRAITTSATVGKQVTASFYGRPHNKSYYLGCSTGGRQGFKMAQDFPDIFDGIVAGAPAFNFQGLLSWSGNFQSIIKQVGPDGFPPLATWEAIDAELLAQCDHLDGAVDGILEDPSLCNFRPEALICETSANSSCITEKQAKTINRFLSPVYGVDGGLVFPRLEPVPGFLSSLHAAYGAKQFLYTDHWYKYALYNDPHLNTTFLGPENWKFAFENDPTGARTWSGNLAQMNFSGTKLLHYHGQEDTLISPASSTMYYDVVSRTMGLSSGEIDDFYRYFRISGMGHCTGGSGASAIGNRRSTMASTDPTQNVLTAMVQWAEEGVAPKTVLGSRFRNGTKALGVEYSRAHCKFPLRNILKAGGDFKDHDDWQCIA